MLTRPMLLALDRLYRNGPLDWCGGSRAGGATSRMFDRMQRTGLVTKPPYRLTDAGLRLLRSRDGFGLGVPYEPSDTMADYMRNARGM